MRLTVLTVAAMLVSGIAGAYAAGLRVNATRSMPIGVWMVEPVQAVEQGSVVTACPSVNPSIAQGRARGFIGPGTCGTGLQPVLKVVVAVAGDRVLVDYDGTILVNGVEVPDSTPLARDGQGRALLRAPTGVSIVPAGFVWLVGQDRHSFDSRYWGPVAVTDIVGAARPLLVAR